jgi:FtsH ternary system domain X3-analog
MPELTIRLQSDPVTGKKNIIISMRGDEDTLPHEHEQAHRALVDKLIQGGVVSAAEAGKIIVEREEEKPQATPPTSSGPQGEKQAQKGGH